MTRNDSLQVGDVIRRLRQERQLSLAGVAEQAGVSVATLSRVETNKQNIDVGLLLTLARILGVPAGELLDSGHDEDDLNVLERRLSRLRPAERTKVFLDSSRGRETKELSSTVDDLLSTLDVLREELQNVHRAVRRRGKR